MDNIKNSERIVNPKQKSNFISDLFFSYTFQLFKKGFKRDIRVEDVYEILPDYKSEKLGSRLEKEWSKKKYRKRPSLYILLWNTFGWNYVFLNMTQIINVGISSVAYPMLIGIFVSYFVPGQTKLTQQDVILYSCLLITLNFVRAIYIQNFVMAITGWSLKLRAALGSFIYRQVLTLKSSQLNKLEIGRYTTIITNDLTDVSISLQYSIYIFGDIFKIFIVVYVMYKRIGWYAFILIITMTTAVPIYVYVVLKIYSLITKRSAKTDERITISKRILTAIRTIKMCTWENIFHKLVSDSRKREVKETSKVFYLFYGNKCIATLFFELNFYFILTTYVEFGENVAAKDIYFVISSLQSIFYAFVVTIPLTLYQFNVFFNALQRIRVVVEEHVMSEPNEKELDLISKPQLIFKNASFNINGRNILHNVDLNIEKGLNLLTGPVGSGKSIFLKLILGDLKPCEGKILCEGRISYASQEPWLFPSTIRQNIVFTEKYNEDRYYQVVRSCALLHDFTLWEKGDQTIVAEHGINLSKGQQSRINLARAVYRKADIYLIDDCFGVLDTIVADFVYRACILELLKNKIVVLVSHKIHFLYFASKEIKLSSKDTVCLIRHPDLNVDTSLYNQEIVPYEANETLALEDDELNERSAFLEISKEEKKVYDEEKESRNVPLKIYFKYLRFGGGFFASILVIITFLIYQIIRSYKDKLLSNWSNLEQSILNYTSNNRSLEDSVFVEMLDKRIFFKCVYAGCVVALVIGSILQAFITFLFAQRASIKFHKYLMAKIIGAQMYFFSSHFLGNILNRLYQDLLFLDRAIPVDVYMILTIFFDFAGSVVLVVSVNSVFLIPTACFFLLLYILRLFYLPTAVNLKRLACSTQSAMIGYMSSTLDGLTTIQVFKGAKILQKEFDRHQDLSTSAAYMHESCRRAFTCAGDLFSCMFNAAVILKFLIVDDGVSAGSVGLAVTQSFMMCLRIYLGISEWANLDTLMTSVERLLEYTKMKQEPKEGLIIEDWPKRAEIKFENVSMSYPNSQNYALKNLNFVIEPGERVGIVGRTGSGKSSIVSALFRLYEIEGKILIDNTDIKTLSLDLLRHQMAVIPQDPFVFPGTIRENIDPLVKYTDEKIYQAMELSRLKQIISNLDYKIKHESDLSVGQKQLICLARVLVRDTKIIIFDEAAENVDHELGLVMKNIVADNINNCTIITIAHKLDFVMDCDKVILIHDGEVGELGRPNDLLRNKNGRFYKLYEKDKGL